MNSSANTQEICTGLIKQMRLPDSFEKIVHNVYLPLSEIIMQKKQQQQTLLVSINGAQGTGKSTLTTFLKHILQSELNCNAAELSLDDFYSTREQRLKLSQQVHPLFSTRGVPGTHDVALLEHVLDDLMEHKSCTVPVFNKAIDDRLARSEWIDYQEPVEVILFEGWCNNSPFQDSQSLLQPVNELEAKEDPHGIWRNYVNEQLKEYHRRIFERADMCIMLDAANFERIYEWRSLQEQKLKESVSRQHQQHVMNDAALKRFIQHYERISRHTLAVLPEIADVVLPVASDHSITSIQQKHV